MAKQSTAITDSRISRTQPVMRHKSHVVMEGLLLLGALGLLCILFAFFTLELRGILSKTQSDSESSLSLTRTSTPPHLESIVTGSQLSLIEIDEYGESIRTLYQSDLSDDIMDFTLFSVPQSGYQGIIYLRPLLSADQTYLKIYPFDVEQGVLKPAILGISANEYLLSADQTVLGVRSNVTLLLYAIEDGTLITSATIPTDWQRLLSAQETTLSLSEENCLALSSIFAPETLDPFPALCL